MPSHPARPAEQDYGYSLLSHVLMRPQLGNLDQLAVAVAENLEILRREVLDPLAGRLTDLGAAGTTVISVGRLSLLPLPAGAPEGCTLALAPSARALHAANRALEERANAAPVLLAMANALPLPTGWNRSATRS